MSNTEYQATERRSGGDLFGTSMQNATLLWASILAGFVFPVAPFIAAIFAYVNRGRSDPALRTHYDSIITTFWVTLIVGFIGGILTWILIGFPILFILAIWTIWRSVRGVLKSMADRPV